jgi:hypothetical protein
MTGERQSLLALDAAASARHDAPPRVAFSQQRSSAERTLRTIRQRCIAFDGDGSDDERRLQLVEALSEQLSDCRFISRGASLHAVSKIPIARTTTRATVR